MRASRSSLSLDYLVLAPYTVKLCNAIYTCCVHLPFSPREACPLPPVASPPEPGGNPRFGRDTETPNSSDGLPWPAPGFQPPGRWSCGHSACSGCRSSLPCPVGDALSVPGTLGSHLAREIWQPCEYRVEWFASALHATMPSCFA